MMIDYSKLVKALRVCNRIDHVGNCNECYYGSPDAPQPKQYVNGCKRSMCEDAANAIEDLQKTLEAVQQNSGINFKMWEEAQAEIERLQAQLSGLVLLCRHRMTKHEAIVVSAYTGFLMCDFNDMHEYIEKKLGRPIYTHEFALDIIQNEIHEKVKPDFLKICAEVRE